jgi:hypothetical protein
MIAMNANFIYKAEISYANSCLPLYSNTKVDILEEEGTDFSTIDGDVVTYTDGADAVNNGAGIFIGDYFVGKSDSQQAVCTIACIR